MARGYGNNAKEHESQLYTLFLYGPTRYMHAAVVMCRSATKRVSGPFHNYHIKRNLDVCVQIVIDNLRRLNL